MIPDTHPFRIHLTVYKLLYSPSYGYQLKSRPSKLFTHLRKKELLGREIQQ